MGRRQQRLKSAPPPTAQYLGSWQAVKYSMPVTKQIEPETIFRVIAPDEAKDADVAELRATGIRTF